MAHGQVLLLAPVAQIPGYSGSVFGPGHSVSVVDEAFTSGLVSSGKASWIACPARQILVTALGTTTATISFTVDQYSLVVRVVYGIADFASTQNATPASGSGAFVANLTGLTTGTTYQYQVATWDSAGNNPAYTDTRTFRTN